MLIISSAVEIQISSKKTSERVGKVETEMMRAENGKKEFQ